MYLQQIIAADVYTHRDTHAHTWHSKMVCIFQMLASNFVAGILFAFVVADEAILGMHLNDFDASLVGVCMCVC